MSSDEAELRALAAAMVGEPVAELARVPAGANSRVYRLRGTSGRAYALKLYADDDRARMERELEGLEFLGQAGCASVPRIVGADHNRRGAVFTWLEGEPVTGRRPGDLAALARFLAAVHGLRNRPGAALLREAREAVTSSAELVSQVERRVERLGAVIGASPALAEVLSAIRREAGGRPLVARPPLERGRQTLSPSDAGFHNAVRRPDGTLAFVDFEYFGWDDPVKLVSDVLWHPGHGLDEGESVEFRSLAAEIYSADPDFEVRFAAFYPWFGLRWALIVLNEFLPKERTRREFAGAAGDRRHTEELQLAKARDLLRRVHALPR